MENKDATHWKKQCEVNEMVLLKALTDLNNYRELVDRLKSEVNHWRSRYQHSEKSKEIQKENLTKILIEDIQSEYSEKYLN